MPRYVENSFSKKANKGKKNLKTIGKLATAAGTTAYASYADSTKKSYSNKNNNIKYVGEPSMFYFINQGHFRHPFLYIYHLIEEIIF